MSDNRIIKWQEPWPGVDKDGNKRDINVISQATADDCVAMTRHNLTKMGKLHGDKTNEQLLQEFITINWAWAEEDE